MIRTEKGQCDECGKTDVVVAVLGSERRIDDTLCSEPRFASVCHQCAEEASVAIANVESDEKKGEVVGDVD